MLKAIKDCTYKEVRKYYENNPMDWEVKAILSTFCGFWVRNENSWNQRMRIEFPKLFKNSVLNKKIEVPVDTH